MVEFCEKCGTMCYEDDVINPLCNSGYCLKCTCEDGRFDNMWWDYAMENLDMNNHFMAEKYRLILALTWEKK